MHPIAATGALSAPMPMITPVQPSSGSSSDLLSAMRPAMDTAFAVGRPTNADGAAAILATTGDYVRGAQTTISKVGEGIARRQAQIAALAGSDPDEAAKLQQQVDLLQKLQDRIQLSIERVMRSASGTDEDDDATKNPSKDDAHDRRRRDEQEQLALLAKRRELLGATVQETLVRQPDASVASAMYADARIGS